jgi:hypothetical protein
MRHAPALLQQARPLGRRGNKKAPDTRDNDDKGDSFPNVHNCYMIFGGDTVNMSPRQRKQEHREVFLIEAATPVYLDWSDHAITFDRDDHPDHVLNPRKYPLVVDPSSTTRASQRCSWMEAAALTSSMQTL